MSRDGLRRGRRKGAGGSFLTPLRVVRRGEELIDGVVELRRILCLEEGAEEADGSIGEHARELLCVGVEFLRRLEMRERQ